MPKTPVEPTMSGRKYREVRKEVLRLSQAELAQKLGVDTRTVANREVARSPISKEAKLALKFVVLENIYDLVGVFEW